MKTLCMDSAHRYLVLALYEDDQLLQSVEYQAWKRQSETLFVELNRLMDLAHWTPDDIDQVVITDGPGSYTGVRIAMSVAKVFCTRKKKPLYTISTMQLYAGMCEHAFVMLDARSSRAYCGVVEQGRLVEESILTLEEAAQRLATETYTLFGDCELIDKESAPLTFARNFMAVKDSWKIVENVHTLVPRYLKEQDAYKVNK